MSRYLIERDFPDGLSIRRTRPERSFAAKSSTITPRTSYVGHSYVTPDRKRTFCIYDGPTPESVRHAAAATICPSRDHRSARPRSVFYK